MMLFFSFYATALLVHNIYAMYVQFIKELAEITTKIQSVHMQTVLNYILILILFDHIVLCTL